MITQEEIFKTALEQSAADLNCAAADLVSGENKIVISQKNETARKYLELPFLCDFVSYGSNIVASVSGEFQDIAEDYISRFTAYHCFETPSIHYLIDRLRPLSANICFMAEYWLPALSKLTVLPCKYETRLITDFEGLYLPEWSHALCEKRKELDVLGIGAYDGGKLIGLAGCSADCEKMYQIGIDVLPRYRRQGIAAALTSALAVEILKRDKIPFYCCAWSNIGSAKNAVRSGFSPAWAEMTVKPVSFIEEMNKNG